MRTPRPEHRYKPIEDYGVIGDMRTVALVGCDGSIDFMCMPEFSSPSVFLALLDKDKGGRFSLKPTYKPVREHQMYLPDTNVLLTRTFCSDGAAEIVDFMPPAHVRDRQAVIRIARALRGEVTFRMHLEPRFDYARGEHRIEATDSGIVFISEGAHELALRLRSQVLTRVQADGSAVAEFTLCGGQEASFVLERAMAHDDHDSPYARDDAAQSAFDDTVDFWRQWLSRSIYQGRWREFVNRSALVLKLLHSEPHGAIMAAPTFGLPEQIGGGRNWDYRYTWIRDASFTVYALTRLGITDEADHFIHWLEDRCFQMDPSRPIQVLYGLDGSAEVHKEHVLSGLEGYKGSTPVKIGNAAAAQLQLDIYGELLDAIYLFDRHGSAVHHDLWNILVRLVEWVRENWRQPDEGIWEWRGGKHEFLHSRVMCWVALDRGIRLARAKSRPAPLDTWIDARDQIYRSVYEEFWNPDIGAFMQYPGSGAVDASALLMPLVNFVSETDPRWISTLDVIGDRLVEDSLVYRYRHDRGGVDDGLDGQEGTFSLCSFWYVECLSRAGRIDKARLVFEKMLSHASSLGLYAEELGRCGEHLGNYPQALTHLGLISAAVDLDRRLSHAESRQLAPHLRRPAW